MQPLPARPCRSLALPCVIALVLALAFARAPAARAASLAVTTTADSLAADGKCSLREAIRAVNAQATVDTCAGAGSTRIDLPAGTYTLGLAGADEDAALTGDLDIRRGVTIAGAGAGATIVDGAQLDRVIDIIEGSVTLGGLTLRNGRADTGGGIRNQGTAILRNVVLAENEADFFSGGGVLNLGTMSLVGVTVADNVAAEEAGGIDNQGTLTIAGSVVLRNDNVDGSAGGIDNRGILTVANTLVAGNTSDGDGGGMRNLNGGVVQLVASVVMGNISSGDFGSAGGIANSGTLTLVDTTIANNRGPLTGGVSNYGALTMLRSTVSSNISGENAGGINNGGTLTIRNSTISANHARSDGGGILSSLPTARASLLNVTLAQNVADDDGDTTGQGGGVAIPGGTIAMTNTVLFGNRAATAASDCAGTLTSFGHNAPGSSSGCALVGSTAGNVAGTSLSLGPLRNNGGATWTHALLAGSPLLDAGAVPACPATDQRGAPRPTDGDRNGTVVCDIGAYEAGRAPGLLLPLVRR
jgi:CSLREA domain-containing protein